MKFNGYQDGKNAETDDLQASFAMKAELVDDTVLFSLCYEQDDCIDLSKATPEILCQVRVPQLVGI